MRKPLAILAAGLLAWGGCARMAGAFVILPSFINPDAWTPDKEAVVNQAISDWTSHVAFEGNNDQSVAISFYFTSAGTGTGAYLAQWQFADVTAAFPYSPTMTHWVAINTDFLDQDSFSLAGPVAGQYDMLTVFEHELGHAMGFAPGVYNNADQTNKWLNKIDGNTFDPAGLNVPMRPDGAHVNVPGDLMYSSLARGVRKGISETDLDMLGEAYGYGITPVPEAGTVGVLGLVVVGLGRRRRARG